MDPASTNLVGRAFSYVAATLETKEFACGRGPSNGDLHPRERAKKLVSCVPESNQDRLCRVGAKVGYSADGATVLGKDDEARDGFSLRLPFDENVL
jgi:hypothetical protein